MGAGFIRIAEGSFIRLETMCAFDVESRLQRWNRNIVLTVKRSLQEEMRCTADREGLFMCTKAKFASRYTDSNIQIGESTHAFLQRRLQNIIVTGANGLVLKRLYLFQCMDERSGDGDTTRQKLLHCKQIVLDGAEDLDEDELFMQIKNLTEECENYG